MQAVADGVAIAFLILGSAFALVAGVGLLRFPDVLSRLHAGTKPQVAGLILIVTGAAIRLVDSPMVWMLVLAGLLQLVTAPLSAHMISRIAFRRRHVRRDLLVLTEVDLDAPLPSAARGDEPADAPPERTTPDPAPETSPGTSPG